jgi:tetratricopeptide (TPR) repeat protein
MPMRAGMAELTEYERAQVHFEMNDYAQAARLLEPFAVEQPRSVSVRLLLARAYYHSAQLGKAEAEFRAVTELDPVEDYAWFCLGRTLERQSRHGEAATCFRMAAAMRPSLEYLDAVTRTEPRAEPPVSDSSVGEDQVGGAVADEHRGGGGVPADLDRQD